MSLANIIACGSTSSLWDGEGYSIGVNDCKKFGYDVHKLIVVNSFRKQPPERRQTIWNSNPIEGFYSHLNEFSSHPKFVSLKRFNFQRWRGKLERGTLYYSISSPLIGISMAFNLGAENITLYGVDFVDHPIVKDKRLELEVRQYVSFIEALDKEGVRVRLKRKYGALGAYIDSEETLFKIHKCSQP